jgi:hypothetical protein
MYSYTLLLQYICRLYIQDIYVLYSYISNIVALRFIYINGYITLHTDPTEALWPQQIILILRITEKINTVTCMGDYRREVLYWRIDLLTSYMS